MEFPFKRRKKRELTEISEAPIQKITGLFKGMRQRRADVEALTRQFHQIKRLPDPGQQLMAYKELQETGVGILQKMTKTSRFGGIGTGLGGLALSTLAVTTFNPLLLVGGIFTMGAGAGMMSKDSKPKKWTVSPALAQDIKALSALVAEAGAAMERVLTQTPLMRIAQSAYFDDVTAAFPALKDRFLVAAAKDKLLQDARRPNPPDADDRPIL